MLNHKWMAVMAAVVVVTASSRSLGQSVELYDNGPFISEVASGYEGADISRAQTSVITFTMYNLQNSTQFPAFPTRVLDDFIVPEGASWQLSRMRIYATQSQAGGTESLESNFQAGFLKIYSADPRVDGGASAVAGDFSTNRLSTTGFTNVYRVSRTAVATVRNNPIFKLDLDASFVPVLPAGHYWVEFTTMGDPARASFPSTFPVTPLPTPNGSQFYNGLYYATPDTLLEAPFKLFGTVVGAGCSIADVSGLGGGPADGQLTADDVIGFLAAYFSSNAAVADIAVLGGAPGHDGQITPDDLVAFLGAFFLGCP